MVESSPIQSVSTWKTLIVRAALTLILTIKRGNSIVTVDTPLIGFQVNSVFECGLPALVGIENIRLHPLIEGRENDLREINFGRGCNSGARDKILPVLYFLKHMKSPIIPDLELPFSDWKIKIISTNLHIKIITGLYQRFLTRQRIGMTN